MNRLYVQVSDKPKSWRFHYLRTTDKKIRENREGRIRICKELGNDPQQAPNLAAGSF